MAYQQLAYIKKKLMIPLNAVGCTWNQASLIGAAGGAYGVHKGTFNGKEVAIKKFNEKGKMITEEQENLLYKEVFALHKYKHDRIVKILGLIADPDDPVYAIVMEYMHHGSLLKYLRANPELPWKHKVRIARDVAFAMVMIYENGSQPHRDLKAANVLIDKHRRAKVADFGLMKIKQTTTKYTIERKRYTITHVAPEILKSPKTRPSQETDVWSYGVILFELATGKEALSEYQEDQINTILKNSPETAFELHELNDTVPESIKKLIFDCCLKLDPSQRKSFKDIFGILRNENFNKEFGDYSPENDEDTAMGEDETDAIGVNDEPMDQESSFFSGFGNRGGGDESRSRASVGSRSGGGAAGRGAAGGQKGGNSQEKKTNPKQKAKPQGKDKNVVYVINAQNLAMGDDANITVEGSQTMTVHANRDRAA